MLTEFTIHTGARIKSHTIGITGLLLNVLLYLFSTKIANTLQKRVAISAYEVHDLLCFLENPNCRVRSQYCCHDLCFKSGKHC